MRPLLTITELAEFLSMTPGAIRTARYRDPQSMPPAVKIGRQLRWDPETVEQWIGSHSERALHVAGDATAITFDEATS